MPSAFKSFFSFLARLFPLTLMVFSLAYSFIMWQILSLMTNLPVYITAPTVCIASLPFSGMFLLFSKKGISKFKVSLFLFLLPPIIPLLSAGLAYIWNSFSDGEFFLCLTLYINGIGWGITLLFMILASVVTLILFKFLTKNNKKELP